MKAYESYRDFLIRKGVIVPLLSRPTLWLTAAEKAEFEAAARRSVQQ